MLKSVLNITFLFLCLFFALASFSCQKTTDEIPQEIPKTEEKDDYKLPNIDLSNWKVTLPIGNPTEVLPPEILDYATNETLLPFMYNDSVDGALVFYTYPKSSTANSSYFRTE